MRNGNKNHAYAKNLGWVIIALLLGWPLEAHAALQSSVNAVIASMQHLPYIMSIAAYIYGAGSVLAGAWKLKTYAEEGPSKGNMFQGISRIAIGGAFSALPALIGYVNSSLSVGDLRLLFNSLQKIS